MATKTTRKKIETEPIMQSSEIVAMDKKQIIATFADRDRTLRRAFSELGKLYSFLASSLKYGETVTVLLTKAGVRLGTISNASYAAEAFNLVRSEHITEAEYDRLTFNDCRAIRKCRDLGVAKLVGILKSETYSEDLASFAEHGMSAADYAAKQEMLAAIEASKPPVASVAPETPAPTETPASTDTPAPVAPVTTEAPAPTEAPATPETPATTETPIAPETPAPANVTPILSVQGETEKLMAAMAIVDSLEKALSDLANPAPVIERIRVMLGMKKAA